MNALRILASPRAWLPVLVVAVVLALVFFAYLAAVVSPEENLEDFPVALVNEDEGGKLAGEEVNLGDQVVEKVTGPDSPASDTVRWARPGSREKALDGIDRNEYYGAIVIPADYSERISALASPPIVPVAVVNEDEGSEINGQPIKLGEEVVGRISGPDSPAPSFVKWYRLDDRDAALRGLEKGTLYAAIVVPQDYSRVLAGMSGPPAGFAAGGDASSPRPARIELLTSPAVRPSTTNAIENAFAGIVGGVSGATSERILDGLGAQGAPVPQGLAEVISDPVRSKVSEAGISGEAGPLPKAPEPARIEVLTNPSAGQSASSLAQNISTGIVRAVSRATSDRLSEKAGENGAQLTPEVAAVVGDPVRADVTEAQPVGANSGNGQAPFFLAFLANLSGFIGAAVVYFGAGGVADTLASRGRAPSFSGLWTMRMFLGLVYAALVAGVELWVAFGLLGVEHEAATSGVYLFLVLTIAAILMVTMLFAAAFGAAGFGIGAVLFVILGLVSSGGLAPLQALPDFYQGYADWLPLRYVIDGLRSLLFYDGNLLGAVRLEEGPGDMLSFFGGDGRFDAAGLEDAVWVLGLYLAGAATLGYLISVSRDLLARSRENASPGGETRGSTAAGAVH